MYVYWLIYCYLTPINLYILGRYSLTQVRP